MAKRDELAQRRQHLVNARSRQHAAASNPARLISCYRMIQQRTSDTDKICRSTCRVRIAEMSPKHGEEAPRRRRGAVESDFGVLGKGKRIFHVDAEIAHRVLDLAMTEKDLDGTKIAGRPVYDRSLRSAK